MSLAIELCRLGATLAETESCEERAAIIEEGGVPRDQAEALAIKLLLRQRQRRDAGEPAGSSPSPVKTPAGGPMVASAPGLPSRSVRDMERLLQGAGAVHSPRRAAELLPGDDAENRAWLRQQGLIRRVGAKEIVVWQEVLDRLQGVDDPVHAPPPPRPAREGRARLPRYPLP